MVTLSSDMPMLPTVSVIIVNWRSAGFVRKCLSTIFADPGSESYEVIVVDNASFDGVAGMLSAEFPQVVFIQCERNLGFAAANNIALRRSTSPRILFLNPDTELHSQALPRLIAALDRTAGAGMVGAKLLNSDGTIQTNCITALPKIVNQTLNTDPLRNIFPRCTLWGAEALYRADPRPAPVQAISGACMLCRRDALKQAGGFSEEYFMYLEDMDLCSRISQLGYGIYYVPDALIVHHGGGSSELRSESHFSSVMLRISLVRYFEIHHGRMYAALYRGTLVFTAAFRTLLVITLFPLFWIRKGRARSIHTLNKWRHILMWSIGLTHTARPSETLAR
jgi:N-acetylglucosaminyl-diphospho-decaprenol L-rhamnosyltransferase